MLENISWLIWNNVNCFMWISSCMQIVIIFFLLKWNTPFCVQSGVYLVVKKCFWILFSWDNNDMQQYDDDLDGMEKTRYNEV